MKGEVEGYVLTPLGNQRLEFIAQLLGMDSEETLERILATLDTLIRSNQRSQSQVWLDYLRKIDPVKPVV
ncbi:MAG: hypothetical protein HY459_03065 [Parcubacteria group bacterium]|nr:hypothetical protein [Parcubacteria group bacterium]